METESPSSSTTIITPLLEKEEEEKKRRDPSTSTPLVGKNSPSNSLPDSENSPVEQVALTVPVTDDRSLPVLTFRMWVLGTLSCIFLSFANQFYGYRKEPLSITSVSAQIAVVPLGHLMASTITDHVFFKHCPLEFTLNPGPFNVKEHVLITIFANSGAGNVYAVHAVNSVKLFYKKKLTFFVSFLLVLTSQVGRYWGLDGRASSGDTWWSRPLCGGHITLFRSLSSGKDKQFTEIMATTVRSETGEEWN